MTRKHMATVLTVVVTLFMLTRMGQLAHHYVVINRDYYPDMAYFRGMAMQYFGSWVINVAGCSLGFVRASWGR